MAIDLTPDFASKYVVDFGGELHSVRSDSAPGPGGYPEGWRDLSEVLNSITDPNAALLIRGLLEENINLKRTLRRAAAAVDE